MANALGPEMNEGIVNNNVESLQLFAYNYLREGNFLWIR
jgi:hypothetical protein